MDNELTARMQNRTTQLEATYAAMQTARDAFRFRPPGYEFMPRYISGDWDGWISLVRRNCVATGLFLDRLHVLRKDLNVVIDDQRKTLDFGAPRNDAWQKARAYQRECFHAMVDASKTGGLVLQSTGSGKTFVAGLFFSALRSPALFFVDELTLLAQAHTALSDLLQEEVGIIGGGKFEPKRITVSTVQTLDRRRNNSAVRSLAPSVVVIDEIHEALNNRTLRILRALAPQAVFGLTATLQLRKRHIRMQAAAMAGPVVYTYPLIDGIAEGYLAHGAVFRIVRTFGRVSMQRLYGDEKYERCVVRNKDRNEFIAALARAAVADERPTIVLVERLDHLANIGRCLDGTPHRVLSGADSANARAQAIAQMKNGALKLIVTNRIFGKGIDIPNLAVTIDATGRQSHNAAQQRFGRGTRKSADKDGLLHFDIADANLPATAARRVAYKKLKVPIYKISKDIEAARVYALAKRRLTKSVS